MIELEKILEDGTAEYGKYLKKLSDFLLTPAP